MSTLIFRTTILGSNPQVVRQFQISDSRPIGDLLICVPILHGWDSNTQMEIVTANGEALPDKGTIAEVLKPGEPGQTWLVRTPMVTFDEELTGTLWAFRLEYQGVNRQEERTGITDPGNLTLKDETSLENDCSADISGIPASPEPWLFRFRGMNPVYGCGTIFAWNTMQQEMMANGECYTYRNGFIMADKYIPDKNQINAALDRRIIRGLLDVNIDRSRGENLSNILSNFSMTDLKQMARNTRMNIDTSLRKAEFMKALEKLFNQDKSWEAIIGAMNLDEYEILRGICYGTNKDEHLDMPILQTYSLIHEPHYSYMKDTIPLELIDYFQKLAENGEDPKILKDKKVRLVLEACRKLYIVFSKGQAKCIAAIMFPDELTEEDMENGWGNRRHFLTIGTDVMYSTLNLEEAKAKELYDYQEAEKIPYYTPEKEELFEIVKKGFHYSENVQEKMKEAIRRIQLGYYQTHTNQDEIAGFVYELYHLGWGRQAIEAQLHRKYELYGSKKDMDALFRLAEASQNEVRQVSLRSHTRREYNQIMDLRKKTEARRKRGERT